MKSYARSTSFAGATPGGEDIAVTEREYLKDSLISSFIVGDGLHQTRTSCEGAITGGTAMENHLLTGKTVVITGGTGGIGRPMSEAVLDQRSASALAKELTRSFSGDVLTAGEPG